MDSGPEQLQLLSNSSDPVSAPWEQFSDASQFFCTVLDIPDFIVKMPVINYLVRTVTHMILSPYWAYFAR